MNNIKYIKYITKIRSMKDLYTHSLKMNAWEIYYELKHNKMIREKEIKEESKLSNLALTCGFNTTKEAVDYFNDDT